MLRILHLEDSDLDHQLVVRQLERAGFQAAFLRVDTREDFEAALTRRWDAIVSDFNLPGFNGLEALALVRARDAITPFILVSGEMGEDTAVAAMRNGASDYLLKNNLARLAPALEHEIDAARAQAAKRAADAELAVSRQRLAELARHLQTGVEAERAAIAREIHDDVGGSLTALKFDLDWIRRHAKEPAVVQRALSALETVTHAIGASQRVMHNLRPAILEHGLVAALQWLASRFEKRTGAECQFRSSHEHLSDLPKAVPLVAYRTAQEALTNIAKHAQATLVTLDLSVSGGVLSLEICDNGRGLSAEDLAKAGSFGIRGLHERASTVGGWMDVSSNAQGTTLMLSIPLQAADTVTGAAGADDDPHHDAREHDPSSWGPL
jgi:signal transduction histidine kinase